VAVKIKLKRLGKIREPYYRIVVADARTKRDGRAIEEIGKYHPKAEPSLIEVNSERVQHWLSVGAQPTDPVRVLLTITGDWQKFTGQSGSEGTLRKAEPRADKKERFASVAGKGQASKETKQAKDDKGAGPGKAATQSRTARPAKDTAAAPPKDGSAKDGSAKDGAAAKDGPAAKEGAAKDGAAAKEGAAKEGAAKDGAAKDGAAAKEGTAREGTAREGTAKEGTAKEGTAKEGTAKEGTARGGRAKAAAAADEGAAPAKAAASEADDGEPGSGA
jgi:small subunit ribosomal protein S16